MSVRGHPHSHPYGSCCSVQAKQKRSGEKYYCLFGICLLVQIKIQLQLQVKSKKKKIILIIFKKCSAKTAAQGNSITHR